MHALKANIYLLKIQNKKLNMFRLSKQLDYLLLTPPVSEKHYRSRSFITRATRKRETLSVILFQVHLNYTLE